MKYRGLHQIYSRLVGQDWYDSISSQTISRLLKLSLALSKAILEAGDIAKIVTS